MTEQTKEVYTIRVKKFTDLDDNKRVYGLGDVYPAEGAKEPSEKRIAALASRANKARVAIIEKTIVTVENENDQDEVKPLSEMTKDQLKALLDKNGVEYNKSASKDELIAAAEGLATDEEEQEEQNEEE